MDTTPTDRAQGRFERLQVNAPLLAVLSLVVSLLFTAWVWRGARENLEFSMHVDFQNHVDRTHDAVRQRMLAYEQVLRGGIGLFNATDTVTRASWRSYVESLDISANFPGIQGIGYAMHMAPADLPGHIDAIRAEGFPDYTVKPAGERPEYTAIIYLEPFDFRNRRAFGFDMLSESTRRTAMERARDTGTSSLSGKVILKQETETDVQAGFLMYLPLYRKGMPLNTVAERQAALQGYVYSPFRATDLMRGILGEKNRDIDLEIYDGMLVSAETLMYDDDRLAHALGVGEAPLYMQTGQLRIQGHVWTLVVSSTPAYEASIDYSKPRLIAVGGVVMSFLFAGLVWILASHRGRAMALARRMTATLSEREAFIHAVIDHVVDSVITVDERQCINSVNTTAEQMFGYSVIEMLGNDLHKLVAEASFERLDRYFEDYLQGGGGRGSTIGCEVTGRRSDGSQFPMELHLSEVSQSGRRFFTVMARDLTQRRQVERLKSEFVSTVSHELRTPLTSIRGSLGLLCGGVAGTLPDQARDLLDIARKNTDRLLLLINDILDIEKIHSGKLEFNCEPTALMPLIEQSLVSNHHYADQYDVTLRLCHDAPGCMVNVDADRLLQVMSNLLSNATKFSHGGGVVEVGVYQEEKSVRVTVTDHGLGIPKSFHDRVFDRFTQADSSDSRVKGGTGLGLSISREIIERLDGSIGFESEIGVGTTFYFQLPRLV